MNTKQGKQNTENAVTEDNKNSETQEKDSVNDSSEKNNEDTNKTKDRYNNGLVSRDGDFTIYVPETWKERKEFEDESVIIAAQENNSGSMLLYDVKYNKTYDLNNMSDEELEESVIKNNAEVGNGLKNRQTLNINGLRALCWETADEKNNQKIYAAWIISSDGHKVHHLLIGADADEFDKNKDIYDKIINSAQIKDEPADNETEQNSELNDSMYC